MMERAYAVLRVSTEDQIKGYGFDIQWDQVSSFIKRQGLVLPEGLVERVQETSTTWDRDRFEAILHRAVSLRKDGLIEWVVFPRVDRFARNMEAAGFYLGQLRRAGLNVGFAEQNLAVTDETATITLLMFFVHEFKADDEARAFRASSIAGRRRRAEDGKLPTGSVNLYGYDYDSATGKRKINTYGAGVVRMMFKWLVEDRASGNEICRRLMKASISAPKGGTKWGRTTVGRILRNPVYCGRTYSHRMVAMGSRRKLRAKEEWIELPDATPPIISEEIFEAAQHQLRVNMELAPRNQKYQWPLRGLVWCKWCGRRYIGEPEHAYRYYRCRGRSRLLSPEPCRNYRKNADWLDEVVKGKVKEVLLEPELLLAELQRRRDSETEVKHFEVEIELNRKRLQTLDEAETRALRLHLYAGMLEGKLFKELQRIRSERSHIEDENARLEKRIEEARQVELDEAAIKRFCELAATNIENFTFDDWRLALEALQIKVWIDGDVITIEGLIPITDFELLTQRW